MPTLFTRIITRELPGHLVYEDPEVVGFLSIAPLRPGHTLVVPRQEIDQWTDAPPELQSALMRVAGVIGQAVKTAFDAPRAGLVIAGFEVPHLHLHVFPAYGLEDFDFSRATPADPADLSAAADRLRAALVA